MIIKFGQNGEQGKKPENHIKEFSGAGSEDRGTERPFLTKEEMFAETPGFWKTDAAGNAEQKPEEEKNISESRDFQKPEQGEAVKSGASERAKQEDPGKTHPDAAESAQTGDLYTDENKQVIEMSGEHSDISGDERIREQPEKNPDVAMPDRAETQTTEDIGEKRPEMQQTADKKFAEAEQTGSREADFQGIERAILRETEHSVLLEEKKQKENADKGEEDVGANKSGTASLEERGGTGGTAADIQEHTGSHRRRRKNASVQKKSPKEEKKERLARSLQEYKRKLMTHRAKKWMRYGAIALAVLVTVLIVTNVVRNWEYTTYSVVFTDTGEDTVSSGYCNVNGNILKYGTGSASLSDRNNQTLWSVKYGIQSPAVEVCGSTVAIYDRNGTGICICDENGQIGQVSTSAPIVRVAVASQGVVAAILEDNDTTWIQYYDQNGESISLIRTTIDSPGYPMDIALSEDGTLMAVSYLCFENGQPKTRLYYYNFGSVGQNMMDNQVSSFEYSDILVPQVEYLNGNICVAFRENGFTVFGGAQIPEERADITVNQEIVSTFYDGSHIGLVLQNENTDAEFQIVVYDTSGRELLRQDTNFAYRSIEIADGQVVMYNQSALCVYSLNGVEKYNGSLELAAQQLFSIGQNRYVVITEDGLNVIKLG